MVTNVTVKLYNYGRGSAVVEVFENDVRVKSIIATAELEVDPGIGGDGRAVVKLEDQTEKIASKEKSVRSSIKNYTED